MKKKYLDYSVKERYVLKENSKIFWKFKLIKKRMKKHFTISKMNNNNNKKNPSDFLKNQKIALSNMNAIYITSERRLSE